MGSQKPLKAGYFYIFRDKNTIISGCTFLPRFYGPDTFTSYVLQSRWITRCIECCAGRAVGMDPRTYLRRVGDRDILIMEILGYKER